MKNVLKHFTSLGKIVLIAGIVFAGLNGLPMKKNPFNITIDGKEMQLDVDGIYVEEALDALRYEMAGVDYIVKEDIDATKLIADVDGVTVATKKIITTDIDGKESEFESYAMTLKEFLEDKTLKLDKIFDEVEVDSDEELINGTKLKLVTNIESLGTEHRDNDEVEEGTDTVLQEGSPRKTITLIQLTSDKDGNGKTMLEKVVDEGTIEIIEHGTKKPASIAPSVPSDSVWDQLAYCESGGRWNVNTGNGYYGGLQFSAPTWNTASRAVGLNISLASDATREEQILAASWLQARSGWGQWPHCSSKLGLM